MPSERFGRRQRARLEAKLRWAPPPRELSWADVTRIEHERFWWAMRSLDRAGLLRLVARALDEVPASRLEHVLGDYVRAGDVGAPGGEVPPDIREAVDRFCALAEAGHFYAFIPYRGTEQSGGTHEFTARFNVLLERCVAEAESIGPMDLRVAMERMMDLSRRIDQCPDDIVHFTDESGSWQIGAAWSIALPVYFRCLVRTATPREYRNAVERAIADFGSYGCVPRTELQLVADETWQSRKSP